MLRTRKNSRENLGAGRLLLPYAFSLIILLVYNRSCVRLNRRLHASSSPKGVLSMILRRFGFVAGDNGHKFFLSLFEDIAAGNTAKRKQFSNETQETEGNFPTKQK